MRQAVMTLPGVIEIIKVDEPCPGPGEVLMRIHRIGVCGSDVHVYHGKHPYTQYPVVQGHEYSAVVETVGEGVEDIRPGMKVTGTPQVVCGICKPCLRGDYHICDTLKVCGFQAPGVAQDLVVTGASTIIILPDEFTFEQGAMVEPVSVGVHATGRVADLAGKNVVVLGVGTIGNLIAQAAKCRGAANILVTDISNHRLEIARQCGLANTSNPRQESLKDAAKRVFGNEGFQVAFECVGVETTMTAAIDSIGKGGTIVVVGVFGEKPRVDLGLVQDRELKLVGTLMYKLEDYREAVRLIASRKILTAPLESKHFSFDQYADSYRFIDEQGDKCMKVFIDVTG
ncbi:MAG: zinc-binding dehydrogenase [bacterium]|nr:zinc-binding dehydrogenase [Candidatus Sumerlaeota bacterium]